MLDPVATTLLRLVVYFRIRRMPFVCALGAAGGVLIDECGASAGRFDMASLFGRFFSVAGFVLGLPLGATACTIGRRHTKPPN